ncbi:MAG: hypothetical protein EOO77_28215 [Oxalobacteraceae bacterium]|nr:MAG: hypothetical protein EOO77_28215 [Oxalobacteraceae bacterium]
MNKRLSRKQTVTITSVISGYSLNIWKMHSENQQKYAAFDEWFEVCQEQRRFIRQYKTDELTKKRIDQYFATFCVPVENPRIVWAGEKGYHKSCDINELLYGRRPPYEFHRRR